MRNRPFEPLVTNRQATLKGSIMYNFVYLEATLGSGHEDNFYTALNGDIDSGGIFVSTFDIKPPNTNAAVSILFPDNRQIAVRGVVHWIRDYNPLVPDMVPGMGIRLQSLDATTKIRIQKYMDSHPTELYDDICLADTLPKAEPTSTQFFEQLFEQDPSPTPTNSDSFESVDHPFYKGLSRDIEAFLQTNLNTPSKKKKKPRPKRNSLPNETIRAQVLPGNTYWQFQGGFSNNDGPHKIFISTLNLRPKGSLVSVVLRSPDGWTLKTAGEVRWMRKTNPLLSSTAAPPGLGIRLASVSAAKWQAIARYLPRGRDFLISEEI